MIEINETDLKNYRNSCDKPSHAQRRKIGPTRRSVSGLYVFRGFESIPFESTLERDFLVRMAYSKQVSMVFAQPTQYEYVAQNGRAYTCVPDYLVYFSIDAFPLGDCPDPMLVEVKSREELRADWQKLRLKFKAARRYASSNEWSFKIFDESRIRGVQLDNIKFLEQFQKAEVDPVDTEAILAKVHEFGSLTVDEILAMLGYQGSYERLGLRAIWHLLANFKLECQLMYSLGLDTDVWVTGDE